MTFRPEVPEAVDVEHGRDQLSVGDGGDRELDADEARRVDLVAEIVEVRACRQMRSDRREAVARLEGLRDLREVILRVGEASRSLDAEAVRSDHQQSVVRSDKDPALAGPDRDGAATAANAGIDDRQVHRRRKVRDGACENQRALSHRLGRDPVGDVEDLGVAGDPLHHAPADADEVVLEPEVGQERDVVEHGYPAAAYSATAAIRPSRS